MALIKCPECQNEVSNTVKKCPHCGYKIKAHLEFQKNDNTRKKIITIIISMIIICGVLFGVLSLFLRHKHTWLPANCELPKRCEECGKTEGNPKGHDWIDATCKLPKSCKVCEATEGKENGHIYGNYTIITPTSCSVSGTEMATCAVCGDEDYRTIAKSAHTRGEWIVEEEPAFDHDGKKAQYCIVCEELVERTSFSMPEEDREKQYREACSYFAYADYVRNPEDNVGKYCKSYGEVAQVFYSEDGRTMYMRVYIEKFTGSLPDVWVVYTKEPGEDNVIEDDIISFYGRCNGTYTYNLTMGGTRTIPAVTAEYVDIGNNTTGKKSASSGSTSSGGNGMTMSSNVFCQEESGFKVTFKGIKDPALKYLREDQIRLIFDVENNTDRDVMLLMKDLAINNRTYDKAAGAAKLVAGTTGELYVDIKKEDLTNAGITSIDTISAHIWESEIGYTSRFSISIR